MEHFQPPAFIGFGKDTAARARPLRCNRPIPQLILDAQIVNQVIEFDSVLEPSLQNLRSGLTRFGMVNNFRGPHFAYANIIELPDERVDFVRRRIGIYTGIYLIADPAVRCHLGVTG